MPYTLIDTTLSKLQKNAFLFDGFILLCPRTCCPFLLVGGRVNMLLGLFMKICSASFLPTLADSRREFSRTNRLRPFQCAGNFKRAFGCFLGILTLCFLFVRSGPAATYYIDYVRGSDRNNGTSESTPWQHQPYMMGFTGSYTHQSGDKFIFKGGVTWPNSCFPIEMRAGGSASGSDYYGVDSGYFLGSSWSQPIFDGGGRESPLNRFVSGGVSYVTFDNIHFTNQYWNSATGGYGTSAYCLGGNDTYVVIENCLFDNWSHDSQAHGTHDDMIVITGAGGSTGNVINRCTFNGAPNGTDSGAATNFWPTVLNSVAKNMTNGFLVAGTPAVVQGCEIGPINVSFSGAHENAIECLGGTGVNIIGNIIHDTVGVTIMVGNPGNTAYIYNNIIWNSRPVPIELDARDGKQNQHTAFIYNNIIDASETGVAISNTSQPAFQTVVAENNQFISCDGVDPNGNFVKVTQSNNLTQTRAQANAAGYSQANLYAPTSSTSPTVGQGLELSSVFTTDILGNTRMEPWDIGAYQYAADLHGRKTLRPWRGRKTTAAVPKAPN